MRTMKLEDVLPEFEEVAFGLVRKVQALSGVSRKDALKIVSSASKAIADNLAGRADGTIPDEGMITK